MRLRIANACLTTLLLIPAIATGQQRKPAEVTATGEFVLKVGPMNLIGGDHEFTRVSAGAFGPKGLIAIAQPQDGQILLFDSANSALPVATAGRRGEGPGEFSSLGGIGWIGSTLWGTDGSRPRAEFFDIAGRTLFSKRFDPPTGAVRPFRFFGPTVILGDSAVVYYPSTIGSPNGPAGPNLDALVPILLQRAGAPHADTLGELRPLRSMLVLRGDMGSAVGTQPFAPRNILRSGANGQRALLVLQAAATVPEGRAEVRVVSSTGMLLFSTDLGLRGGPITTPMWDSVVTQQIKAGVGSIWSTEAKARSGLDEALVRARSLPVIADAVLGQDGTVWLRMVELRNGKAIWRVLSSAGEQIADVTLPADVRILDVTAMKALGVTKDADGVEQPFWVSVVGRTVKVRIGAKGKR